MGEAGLQASHLELAAAATAAGAELLSPHLLHEGMPWSSAGSGTAVIGGGTHGQLIAETTPAIDDHELT